MIAKPHQHFDDHKLQLLLEDRLSHHEAQEVESHLARCESCREDLEQLAGNADWWTETVDVLSQTTMPSPSPAVRNESQNASPPSASFDRSLDWIRPLLEPVVENETSGTAANHEPVGRIDQYPVQNVIGQGGMGVVLKGHDPELNRPVAIKVLSPHLAGVGAARARFMREAQAAAAIVHPSIVPIYSVVPSARLPYIVMPCIAGGNLQQRIDRDGPLELTEVLRIGLQIAEGLAAAHRGGVIHRDIKPANVLVEEGNGRVLISDFGLARVLDDATLTVSGMIAGTPQYMSPEQARGDSIDARSDLFSLGSLLYALATGRAPFRAETPLGVLRKITDTDPKPVQEINERFPAWFDALVGRLMNRNLGQRIRSADEAVRLIREAHSHVRNPSANSLPSSLTSGNDRRTLLAWAIATTALIIVAAKLAFFSGDSNSNRKQPAKMPQTAAVVTQQNTSASSDWNGSDIESELKSIQMQLDGLSLHLNGPPSSSTTPPDQGTQK